MSDQLSDAKLNFGIWLAENKSLFRKVFVVSFIIIDTLLVVFALYGAIKYYIIDYEKHRQVAQTLSQPLDFNAYRQYNQAIELEVIRSEAVVRTVTGDLPGQKQVKKDYVAKIKNLNKKRFAIFQYRFTETEEFQEGFILPSEEKYITQINVEGASGATGRLEIKDLRWKRVNAHEIPDYIAYETERLRIEVDNVEFQTGSELGVKDVNELSFNLANKSAYNFGVLDLVIVLRQGSKIVGVNSLKIDNFLTGQKEEVKMNWLGYLPSSVNIEIEPQVNILDKDAYLEFESIPGERK